MLIIFNRKIMKAWKDDLKNIYLNLDEKYLRDMGAIHTAREISHQPWLWRECYNLVQKQRIALGEFLKMAQSESDLEIILTGAGTSAFIGDILEGPVRKATQKATRTAATTDLVTHPDSGFTANRPTLLVSFARSGNSPESLKTVELADQICNKVFHLIITCNADGEIASYHGHSKAFVFILPPQSNDQSLAMTSSFSSMLLSALLIFRLDEIDRLRHQVDLLARCGERLLSEHLAAIRSAAELDFSRAVFLGSGPLRGAARESQLKLQEMTDGQVICKNDSYLGFRHGPKAVVNEKTLLVFLLSTEKYVEKYEQDLIKSMKSGSAGLFQIGIMQRPHPELTLDLSLVVCDEGETLAEELWAVCSVIAAQALGFFKALNLSLQPDNPSVKGSITRVVQGVHLYSWENPAVIGA
jgi:tagatose-6-phosphate ketose/aldose isomerase